MENKIRIGVMISHYTYAQGRQYTSDIEPLEVDEETLKDQVLLQKAIDEYCQALASVMIPYDTEWEDYILAFWYNDVPIKRAFLGDYSDYFGRELDEDDIEIAE